MDRKLAIERLMARVVKADGGCWIYLGTTPRGYGQLAINGRFWYAHRLAYHLYIGAIPTDREIDHLCRNRACVNPEHLEAVSHRENCRRGELGTHPNSLANLRPRAKGGYRRRVVNAKRG